MLLVEIGDFEEAKNNFDKVTEIDQNYSSAYFQKAKLLNNADDFEEARKNYETAIDIEETFIDALYYLAQLAGGVATDKEGTLVDKTDLPSAKKHLLKVLEMDENHARACTTSRKFSARKTNLKRHKNILFSTEN